MKVLKSTEQKSFMILMFTLLVLGLYLLLPFLYAIVLSISFSVLFYPLHIKYLNLTKQRKNLSAALSVISVILFLIVPIAILLTLVTTQITQIAIPQNIHLSGSVASFLTYWQEKASRHIDKIHHLLGLQFEITPWIQREIGSLAQTLARYSPNVISGTANFFLNFFIMMIVLFYLFRDGATFFKTLVRITPIKDQYELKLASEIKLTINGVFYGNFLTSLVQAILATLGYYIVGIGGFLVWGLITFFMSFLPAIGTGAIVVPMVISLLVQGLVKQAVILLIYSVVVIGTIDNLLRPFLMKSNMHELVLFLSIFGGLSVFGPIGLLLGPILMGMLTATVRIYDRDFVKSSE